MSNLEDLIEKKATISDLIKRKPVVLTKEEKERHRIYASLLFAITAHYFNPNKYGDRSEYPLSPSSDGILSGDYYGHNIAAIAVNKFGEVVDFEFNHNKVFNSSVEHAESRLIRRIFSLSQVHNSWQDKDIKPKKYGNMLEDVTVYTTLESCTQCTGIMTLGNVSKVVYLQPDPGMYCIGNIVRNITEGQGYLEAPLPISGEEIDFAPYVEISNKFEAFKKQQKSKVGKSFAIFEDKTPKWTSSITSFLCTSGAYNEFLRGREMLMDMTPDYGEYKPNEESMSNSASLDEAKSFYDYCVKKGNRGTPHRM